MRLQPVTDPAETYSAWDSGWRLLIAWCSSFMVVVIGLGNLTLLLEVMGWWF